MSPTFAKVMYGGKVQTIALFPGIENEELISLLKTVFSISESIVGFLAEVQGKIFYSELFNNFLTDLNFITSRKV
jgi:hypothetical protein